MAVLMGRSQSCQPISRAPDVQKVTKACSLEVARVVVYSLQTICWFLVFRRVNKRHRASSSMKINKLTGCRVPPLPFKILWQCEICEELYRAHRFAVLPKAFSAALELAIVRESSCLSLHCSLENDQLALLPVCSDFDLAFIAQISSSVIRPPLLHEFIVIEELQYSSGVWLQSC